MTREMKQIFTRRITQANRTQLVVILYDMVLEYLKEAITAQEIDCIQEYKKAMHSINKESLSQIAGMFQKLRGAYYTISKEDHSQPLMQNAQNVYAGYTYGRTDVNESLYSGAARGYCV